MTDKINNLTTRLAPATERKSATIGKAGDARTNVPGVNAAAGADSVKLTSTAQRLAQLEAAVRETPDVRADRVAELRQMIADGRYAVDAQLVADRLLSSEAALLPALNKASHGKP